MSRCHRCDGQGRIVAFAGRTGSICTLCLGTGLDYAPAAGPLADLGDLDSRLIRLGGVLRDVFRDGHRFRVYLRRGVAEFRLDGDRPIEWSTRGIVSAEEKASITDYCEIPICSEAA